MKKKKEKFCALCSCPDHTDMPLDLRRNWLCPILKKRICLVDCHYEVSGGTGAPDTLRRVCKMMGMSPQEIHAACVKCRHGGKALDRPGRVVAIAGKDGKEVTSGLEIERIRKKNKAEQEKKLRWLRGDLPKSVIRRLNVQRGFAP